MGNRIAFATMTLSYNINSVSLIHMILMIPVNTFPTGLQCIVWTETISVTYQLHYGNFLLYRKLESEFSA